MDSKTEVKAEYYSKESHRFDAEIAHAIPVRGMRFALSTEALRALNSYKQIEVMVDPAVRGIDVNI